MEREQAEREQQELLAGESWAMEPSSPPPQQQQPLDESFHPEAFVNVGNYLNSQGLGQEPRFLADSASQTPARTTASAFTQTASPPASPPAPPAIRRMIYGLLALVGMVAILLGTTAHYHGRSRAWEAENSALRARITKLENARTTSGGSADTFGASHSCPGNQLLNTCWFTMGVGDCTKDLLEDPVKPLEDAFKFAWDSTAEVVGAVTDTVASDLRQVCDAMQSFGRFIFEL